MSPTTDNLETGQRPRVAAAGMARAFAPLFAVVAALLGALVYRNALDNPFVYDDYRLIVDNPALRDPTNLWPIVARDLTRPLVALSYALDTAVWGLAPDGYHLTNILLHFGNVLLVFRFSLMACEDRRQQTDQPVGADASPLVAAFAAALLFAVHPMMTEAVGYITGRAELAYGYLFFLAFLAGRHWMTSGAVRWWIACVVLWGGALLAKETAVVLPFVLVAYEWLVLRQAPAQRQRRLLALGLPLVALTVAAGAVRIAVLWFVEGKYFGADWRFGLMAAEALWRYLGLFAFPEGQGIYHAVEVPGDTPPLRMVAAVVALVAAPLAAWGFRRIHSVLAFGGLWFVLMLLPSAALFTLGVGEPLAERRGYVAAAGLFLTWGSVFSMLWARTSGRHWLRATVAATAILFVAQLSVRTWLRNEVWGDPVQLALESVALAPDHWIPRMLLGETLRQAGHCDDAIPAFQQVIARRPREKSAYTRLSGCLIREHRFDEARDWMLHWKTLDPAAEEASVTLGILSLLENDPDLARVHFRTAVEQHPSDPTAGQLLAFVNDNLQAEEHRRFCEEFHAMAGTFDFRACMGREAGRSSIVVRADRPAN